jgi:hypothetical protein
VCIVGEQIHQFAPTLIAGIIVAFGNVIPIESTASWFMTLVRSYSQIHGTRPLRAGLIALTHAWLNLRDEHILLADACTFGVRMDSEPFRALTVRSVLYRTSNLH